VVVRFDRGMDPHRRSQQQSSPQVGVSKSRRFDGWGWESFARRVLDPQRIATVTGLQVGDHSGCDRRHHRHRQRWGWLTRRPRDVLPSAAR
jgi:hypothetical protein